MTGAMYAAIGGLKTHMSNLNVIGNNIANVNTAGYKAQRMTFQESIYTTSKSGSDGGVTTGGNNPSQVGYGAQVGSIDINMAPGTFNPTGFDLDCMIEGDGFFLVGDKDMVVNSAEDLGGFLLTRVGDFWQDAQGYITNRDGKCVYGFATIQNPYYNPNAEENDKAAAEAAGFNTTDKYVVSTQLVPLRIPLAAAEPTEANGGIDPTTKEYKWNTGDPVFDLLGPTSTDPENANARKNVSVLEYTEFKDDGKVEYSFADGVGAADGKTKTDYKGPVANEEGKCVKIKSLAINELGAIYGTTDSGTVVLGYVAIGNVMAPDGVTHVGGPYYQALEGSGDLSVSAVGGTMSGRYLNNKTSSPAEAGGTAITPPINDAIGAGKGNEIRNGGLEASTADVATEFSNMILTQRGYQANTRIVTVTDSMLEELVNMKR